MAKTLVSIESSIERRLVLEARGITKEFPGVVALNNINITFFSSEVHALLGENGAGKSTLMKVINGDYPQTSGQMFLYGENAGKMSPKKAQKRGIAFIRQELNLIPEMTVAENIFLGREEATLGKINWRALYKKAGDLLDEFGLDIAPKAKVNSLSVAQQQIVEIAKALSLNANIIIFDEPTDVLTDAETEKLFSIIRQMKESGKAIIYISHRLEELKRVCDVYTVLRDGNKVGDGMVKDVTQKQIIEKMVGRKLTEQYPRISVSTGEEILKVENLFYGNLLKDISFSVRAGEILCFSGLVGAGRSELMKCIFGAERNYSGSINIQGISVKIKSVRAAMKKGIFFITEDRKSEGIIADMSIRKNLTLSNLGQFSNWLGVVNSRKEQNKSREIIKEFGVKTPSENREIKYLSGGNQQKVLIAKGFMTKPQVLIIDEPTRGIDVGSKVAIYNIINDLKKAGVAIILVSSEIPEVLGISDRVIVMSRGKINGEFTRSELTEEKILNCAFGLQYES